MKLGLYVELSEPPLPVGVSRFRFVPLLLGGAGRPTAFIIKGFEPFVKGVMEYRRGSPQV